MKNKQEVLDWASDKGLLKHENRFAQFAKVIEEVSEIGKALHTQTIEEVKDGIGDSLVTLIILADQCQLDIEDCLEAAYKVIKDRKGSTINGTFIKN